VVVDLNSTPLKTVSQFEAVVVPLKTKIPVVVLKAETVTPEGNVAVDLSWSPLAPLEKL
jgi:hypothetical protein